jgi:hypothetical protein
MNEERLEILRLNKFREEAIKFLSDKRSAIISEDEITQAVQLIFLGYSLAVKNKIKHKSNRKIQNLNLGIIMSEWSQTS